MSDLLHWHKPGDEPSVCVMPPECCVDAAEKAIDKAATEAERQERSRIIRGAVEQLAAYRASASSVLTDDATLDMLRRVVDYCADLIRRAGCICPLIEDERLNGRSSTYPGFDPLCGAHGARL